MDVPLLSEVRRAVTVALGAAAVVALVALGAPMRPAAAHSTPTADNVTPDGCEPRDPADPDPGVVLFGDSQSQDVYAFKGRSVDYASIGTQARRPPPDAVYLADWYRARGWDVCEAAADGQEPLEHGPYGQYVELGSGRPLDDVLAELGDDRCAAVAVIAGTLPPAAPPCPTGAGEDPHFDLTELVRDFHADELVLNGGWRSARVVLIDRWFRWWSQEGATPACPVRPDPTVAADPIGAMSACPPALPDRYAGLTFEEAVDEESIRMIHDFADRLFADGLTRIHWLLRFRTAGLGDLIWPGERALVSEAVSRYEQVAGSLAGIDQGLDVDGAYARVDRESGQGNHLHDPGPVERTLSPSARDWRVHLTAFGGWRAARTVAEAICPTCPPVPDQAHQWPDTPGWIQDALVWIDAYDLMAGYPDGRFRGGRAVSRAELVSLLHRIVGRPPSGTPHRLSDVPRWINPAVRWAAEDPPGRAGPVMTGYRDGRFRPERKVTRGEALAAFHGLATPATGVFAPSPLSGVPRWLVEPAAWAGTERVLPEVDAPLLSGRPDGSLDADGHVTRAELARLAFRALGALVPSDVAPRPELNPTLLKSPPVAPLWAWGRRASAHWDVPTDPSEAVEHFPWTYRY